MNGKRCPELHGLDDEFCICFCQIGHGVAQIGLFGAVAVFAQALQIKKRVRAAVFLRDDVVNVHVRLAKFLPATCAGVPAVIRRVMFKPFFAIVAQKFQSPFEKFSTAAEIISPSKPRPERNCHALARKFLSSIVLNFFVNAKVAACNSCS